MDNEQTDDLGEQNKPEQPLEPSSTNQEKNDIPIQSVAEEPKPKTSRKKIAAAAILVLACVVGAAIWATNGSNDNQNTETAASTENEVAEVQEELIVKNMTPSELAGVEYVMNPNGNYFSLEQDSLTWLERSQTDWSRYVSAGDWLYFISETAPNEEVQESFTLNGFNFATRDYATFGTLTVSNERQGFESPLYVQGDYVYASLGGYKVTSDIHRCKISSEDGCGETELFYDKDSGAAIRQIEDETYFLQSSFGDGGFGTTTTSILDPKTKDTIKIVTTETLEGEGTNTITIDNSGLIWIAEFELDGTGPYESSFVRLYSVDRNGKETASIDKASVPLKDISFMRTEIGDNNKIIFYNETKEAAYNTESGSFGAVSDSVRAPGSYSEDPEEVRNELIEQLSLPSSFTLKLTKETTN